MQYNSFTRSQFCIRCNDTNMHNWHNTFTTRHKNFTNILVLVVRRFDNDTHKIIAKLKRAVSHKIDNYEYRLNSLIEHHGENISRGHYGD